MLKSRAPWLARAAAYALLVQELVRISLTGVLHSMDNLLVVDAARGLLDGASPYESDRFLYPPSSVPFALAMTPLNDTQLERVFPWLLTALLLTGWWAALRMFGAGLHSWLGVAGIAGFALFNPAVSVVELGNWTAPVAAAMSVALLLMGRGRWLVAGVLVPGSTARSAWFWIASVPLVRPLQFIGVDFLDGGHAGYRQAVKPLAWMAVAGALLLVRAWRGQQTGPPVESHRQDEERVTLPV